MPKTVTTFTGATTPAEFGPGNACVIPAGFKGTLAEYIRHLRTDPRFTFPSKEAMVQEYRALAKRIDPELPRLFRTTPRLPYGIEPMPEYSEKTAPGAYYQPGTQEAGRAGTFQVNTYNLPARPRWEMEALTLHEAVPGHHLQIALAQEMGDMPDFRKHTGYTAFVEGWGLYSESLGEEMGFYTDPYSKFGQLTYEMWRAVRLVVDTGMHALGWSRQQAIDFFKDNAGKSEHDIEVEIDRYIVWPGQATGYKVGMIRILELRELAKRELGAKFYLRAYHDLVLKNGALPMNLLEESRINHAGKLAFRWIYWNALLPARHLPIASQMSMRGKVRPQAA